ncbi:MAG: peptidyl-prolyl cis-trans isomerase [Acidimicrobiaceae bacterium]|jgi:cyclophilin family peptidyl-prolyl cis-trans isomerase
MPSAKRERQREGRQARVAAAVAEQKRRQRWRTVRNFVLIVIAIVAVIVVISLRSGSDKKTVTAASGSSTTSTTVPPVFTYGTGPCPNADGSSPKTIDFTAAPKQCIDPTKAYTATFDTSIGTIVVKLDTEKTPGTTNNFVVLARYHYYDGTQIFRTAQSIGIVQGGSPHTNTAADPGPGYNLPDEGYDFASLPQGNGGPYSYLPGDLVMARRAVPNGASAQFFFAVDDKTASLDSQGVYVKFGTTTQGLDSLVFFLGSEPSETPVHPVTINTVTITES